MKKQILSLAVIALLAFAVQSCGDKELKPKEDNLTLGNKVDSLTTDIEEVKDTAVVKVENAASEAKEATNKTVEEVKDAAKKTAADVKEASQKAADKAETAKDVNEALKK
jgi:ElaB/YqjD/DUF883 family membrane-anchored ribosome-binding protein